MFTNQLAATLDTLGTARNNPVQAQQNAGRLFDRLHEQARLGQWWAMLTGRTPARRSAPAQAPARRANQVVSLPLEEIVGSEDRSEDFDAAFRPLRTNTRERWIGIAMARRKGVALPAVELVRRADGYYVRDGHHRISVAKAMGQLAIEARIVNS